MPEPDAYRFEKYDPSESEYGLMAGILHPGKFDVGFRNLQRCWSGETIQEEAVDLQNEIAREHDLGVDEGELLDEFASRLMDRFSGKDLDKKTGGDASE